MFEGFSNEISRNPIVEPTRYMIFKMLDDIRNDLLFQRDILGEDITHGVEVAKVYEKYVNDVTMSLKDMRQEIEIINNKFLGSKSCSMFDNMC